MDPTGSPFRRPPPRPAFRARRSEFGPVPAAPLTASARSAPAGLGLTRWTVGVAPSGWMALALAAGFALLGLLAQRGRLWAFAVGAAVYALDGLIVLAAHDWVAVAIHTVVLVMMVRGLEAGR